MKKEPDAHDVSSVTNVALECRELGHQWVKKEVQWRKKTPKGKTIAEDRVLMCLRCEAERIQQYEISVIHGRFTRIGHSRMKYPPGYLVKGTRLSRAEAMYHAYLRARGEE
jgi:hypothetical protein